MEKIIILLLLFNGAMYAQDKSVYYDKDWKVTSKDSASFYRIEPIKVANLWLIKDYYINGKIQFKGTTKDIQKEKWHGDLTWYYPNGRITSKERYKDGKYIGSFAAFESEKPSQEKGFEEKNLYFVDESSAEPAVAVSEAVDTLRVYQNDPILFLLLTTIISRPCSKPKGTVSYKLRNPKNNVYYYIYNDKKQLVKEGKYTLHYSYEGVNYKGGFYNLKYYYYRKNGSLQTVHYQEDGRNSKTELYNKNHKLKQITYIDKKTETPTKMEYYRQKKKKKTRFFTNYYANKYYTIKAKNKIN